MNLAFRVATGAVPAKSAAAEAIEGTFRQDAARRIAGTQKQHVVDSFRHARLLARLARTPNPQSSGWPPQQSFTRKPTSAWVPAASIEYKIRCRSRDDLIRPALSSCARWVLRVDGGTSSCMAICPAGIPS